MRFYHRAGARGITYMHVPIVNWSVRGIVQGLHALLAWDVDADVNAFVKEYVGLRYGKYAPEAETAVAEIEKASRDVAEWRAWGTSILTSLDQFAMTGRVEGEVGHFHYRNHAEAIAAGNAILRHYRRAARIIGGLLDRELENFPAVPGGTLAMNPEERARAALATRQTSALECDLRMLNYATDVFSLMLKCLRAYDAVMRKDREALERVRPGILRQARRMSLYTESLNYRAYEPFIETPTALRRSQCDNFIRMLRNYRIS